MPDTAAAAAAGAAVGALAMYLLDPRWGRRRRALARDKAVHYAHGAGEAAETTARDSRNRLRGLLARGGRAAYREPVDDGVLEHRVRAVVGRVSRHTSAIDVEAREGRVVLSGPVLADEADRVRRAAFQVSGVQEVKDRLRIHEQAGTVSALQGGDGQPHRPEPRFELLQERWSPTARVLTGATGAGLAVFGASRRGLAGGAATLAGAALAARAVTNLPARRLTGVRAGRRAVDVRKAIHVDAPVEQVWELWERPERLPELMTHVREVHRNADGSYHWRLRGPAGISVEWDADVTASRPKEEIAWRSRPGAAVQHAGAVQFEREDGGTRVQVRLSYNPPAGATAAMPWPQCSAPIPSGTSTTTCSG